MYTTIGRKDNHFYNLIWILSQKISQNEQKSY